jgi:hypothetical protein
MYKRIALISTFLITSFLGISQQSSKFAGGIVYGPKAAFQIFAPDNWILDNQVGMSMGLPCVLYLKDYNWSDSPVIMYAKIASTDYETCKSFIDFAIQSFKNRDTSFTYTKVRDYVLKDKFDVIVNDYTQKSNKQYDRVAYIQVKNAVCYIVFSTAIKGDFEKYSGDIYKVIDSFVYKPEFINYKK